MERTSIKEDQTIIESITGQIGVENLLQTIGENLEPNQVFETETLEAWAEENGYEKKAS